MFKQRQFESCAKSSQPKATKKIPFLLPRLECRMIGGTENTLKLELASTEYSLYCSEHNVHPAPSGRNAPFRPSLIHGTVVDDEPDNLFSQATKHWS